MKDAIIVTAQGEMDAVIADASIAHRIEVRGNGLISVGPQCPLDVWACDSVTVTACGSATVTATSTVSIHKTNDLNYITGGVVIDHTTTDATTPTRWATENGASVSGGEVKLYKALPDHRPQRRPS